MWKRSAAALGLLFSLGWMWAVAAQAPPDPAALPPSRTAELLRAGAEPVRVVCLGDSVTGVYYHTGGRRAYSHMLRIALNRLYPGAPVDVINAGISGNTTVDALNRLDSDVLAHKPHLVTVMFGLNDMKRVPMADFEANLTTIIHRCRDTGAEVVLCTPNSITDTESRSTTTLIEYVDAIRRAAEREQTPVADCYAACEAIRSEDAFKWLMLMSDEIHPNMVGHKLLAETIAHTASGEAVSLEAEGPPQPPLPHTMALLKEGKPVRVCAMPPYDGMAASALKAVAPQAQVEATPWVVDGQTAPQIEEGAKQVRELKPDLVIVAVPSAAAADSKEEFVRSYKWVLNKALSFGYQEWDCVAVVPSVTAPITDADAQERERLARALIWAQDIGMIERAPGDTRSAQEVFTAWIRDHLTEPPNQTGAPNAATHPAPPAER